jgi:hypothetical protein
MRTLTIVAALAAALAVPVVAAAQAPAPPPDPRGLQLEIKPSEVPPARGRLPVVRPAPPMEAAVQDAEALTAEIRARQDRSEEVIREHTQPTVRPPWRDRDVTNGIQGMNLQRALGR